MNVRIAILKVLSSYPDGRASFASLKSDLEMLSTSEWLARMRELGARAGTINIFSHKLATRDASGWTITQAGRNFLNRLERGEAFPGADEVTTSKAAAASHPIKQAHLTLVRSA